MLAEKFHQEHVTNIYDFILRVCVYYQNINDITEPFEFLVPHCDDTISSVGAVSDTILSSSLTLVRANVNFK